MSAEESIDQEYVAIIGMAGRFPGARDIDTFWRNLRQGVESISRLTPEELAASGIPAEVSERSDYVPAKGILEDPEHFDAEFFGLTPREAEVMDPQHRLFLECCWQTCEDAGYDIRTYSGRAGVYAGGSSSSYLLNNLLSNPELLASVGNLQARLGNDQDFLTTRASYKLNLRGPSFAVQTACSTSLLAVHLACQGLLDGECSLALAGGVSVSYPHRAGYIYLPEGIRSPDGHCRAFDADAAGSVEGNGVGMVMLKRLSEALADGDTIRAVIRGSASNNDGSLKAGFTAPSVESQSLVISEALSMAGVPAATVGYVEAHGSGTLLGDPIEVEALSLAFGDAAGAPGSCALGSVKTSIGHLDAAAGIASLIKTVRALEAKILPPSPYYRQPNPSIDFAASPFYINREARPWAAGPTPRRAGVSSFGIGGTNVHAVLEEAPAREPGEASRPWQLLVLSARSGDALAEAAAKLHHQLEEQVKEPECGLELADVAYTLGIGRERFQHRRALVCRDPEELLARLGDLSPEGRDQGAGMPARRAAAAREPGIAMLFPGLGDHHAGMTRELYRQEPTFRHEIDRCADFLRPTLGIDLREVLYPEGLAETPSAARPTRLSRQTGFETSAESAAERRLHQTLFAHPILFMTEVALARLLMEWGLRPAAMIGYSLGEYAAAHLAGVFSLEDGLALVADRARMIDELPGGAMLAIPLAETELSALLEEAAELSLAAANGHSLSVVGGPEEAVDRLAQRLAGLGVACQRLRTTHAFHSKMLEPIRERLRRRIAEIPLAAPEIPFLSNTTGTWIRAEEATDPAYWAEHTVLPVRFSDSLGRLMKLEHGEAGREHLLLEVGPGQGLSTLARQHEERSAQVIVSCLPDRRDGISEMAHLLTTVGRLWTAGAPLDWQGFYRHQRRRRVPLPTYPFERQRYWVEPGQGTGASLAVAATPTPTTTRKAELGDWFYLPSWERTRPVASRPVEESGSWLVLLDELGLGARLAERLRRLGQRVLTVAAGSGFGAQPNDAYTLDPGRREDYQALVAALEADGVSLRGIVHLFGLTPESDAVDPWVLGERFDELMNLGFYSLLFLAQALGEKQLAAGEAATESPARTLTVISNQLHEVTGEETLCPAKAMLLGPMKVMPQEVSDWTCRGIDVVAPALDSAAGEQLIADLTAELTVGSEAVDADDPGSGVRRPGGVIAYRGRHRWRRTFPRVRLENSSEPPRLRRGGVYVITGGADETSLVMAEHLTRRVAARLVFLVPEDFPRREDWESSPGDGAATASEDKAKSPEDEQVDRAIRRLQALEERSGALLLLPVDLTDPAAVARALAAARQRFGEINGVLHTAMVAGGGLIQLKTRQLADAVLAPKVAATLALARALEAGTSGDRAPDFFALFSSNVAITGGLGQVDFAAANAFLDAFARRCALRGGSADLTLAIDWGSFRWEAAAGSPSAGMPEVWEQLEHNLETYGIDAAESGEVLERALAAGLPQVVVSPRDLAAVRRDFDALTASSLLAEIERGRSRDGYDRPELEVAYAAPSSELEEKVAAIWREVFGLGKVGVHDNFFDLSGNSLLALQIVTRVRTDFQVDLPMTSLFEAPTVAELARQVEDLQGSGETEGQEAEDMGAFYALLSEVEGLSDTDAKTRLGDVKSEGTDG